MDKLVLGSIAKALDYHIYGLHRKSQHFYSNATSNVTKFFMGIRSQLKKPAIDRDDPISILSFLKTFRDSYNSIRIYEAVSMRVFSKVVEKPASSSFSTRPNERNTN